MPCTPQDLFERLRPGMPQFASYEEAVAAVAALDAEAAAGDDEAAEAASGTDSRAGRSDSDEEGAETMPSRP